jgi:uracil-DNA glycosylase
MRVRDFVACVQFPCQDVQQAGYSVPEVELLPEEISIVLISEAAPAHLQDGYYAAGTPLFARTTVQAFNDAGAPVASIRDILGLGVYLTSAVKCAKTGYGLKIGTVEACSRLLEQELDLFPRVQAYLLMGDVAIQAVNFIAKRAGTGRAIPAGSTYKIRGGEFFFRGARAFPSYLQAGPSFFIEKSKRRMIAEDIRAALRLVHGAGPANRALA